MRVRALVVGLALSLGFALPASADTVLVSYTLTGTISNPGLIGPLGPAPGGGVATFEFQGTPGSGILPGAAHLVSFGFVQGPVSFTALAGGLMVTGPAVTLGFAPSGVGTLTAGGALSFAGLTGILIAPGLHCTGGGCAGVPLPVSVPFTLGFPVGALAGSLTGGTGPGLVIGPGFVLGTITPGAIPLVFTLSLTGAEIPGSRVHIPMPEPSVVGLMGLSLLALGGTAWRARRRRS